MREWHVEHMEKTVVKYVKGLSENASGWEKEITKNMAVLQISADKLNMTLNMGSALSK